MEIPADLESRRSLGLDWGIWLDRLPRLADELLEEWQLSLDGSAMHGWVSLVLPVRATGGRPAALKITWDGDVESEHEGLALQAWAGEGAVRLLRADPHRRALLLERLIPEDLTALGDVEACEVVGGLYHRIHVPALPQLRTITSYVATWTDALQQMPRNAPIPRRLVEQASALARDFVADEASIGTLIHGDLHYENVLAGQRDPWVVIDPKPMSGDPHYEPASMLWNRMEELGSSSESVRDGLRRRFHTLVDVAGLDDSRARDWVVVRMVINAGWAVQHARRAARDLNRAERDRITGCIAIIKAVQD